MTKKKHRIYLIYGQGGDGPLSYGFHEFKNRLSKLGYEVFDNVLWNNPQTIAANINLLPHDYKAVLLGYSLGANACTWIANPYYGIKRNIDLIVGYDPSWLSPLSPIGKNVKKTLCYNAIGLDPAGHAIYTGHNVEVISHVEDHLGVDYDETFHQRTLQELKGLIG